MFRNRRSSFENHISKRKDICVAVPKKRTSRGSQGRRRSHLALEAAQLVTTNTGRLVPRRLKNAAELGLLSTAKKA